MSADEPELPRNLRDDAELFACHLAGDHDALMDLFDRHNQRIYLYCLKIVNDRQQASDLTQELWEKIIRMRVAGAEPPRKPLGLLLTIARNLCLNYLRSQQKFSALDDMEESEHPTALPPERSHLEELVLLALPKLPLAQREVLILNAYSGYGFDEIAEIMGKPVGAIHTAAWRARLRLGKLIAEMIRRDRDRTGNDHDALEEPQ